MDYPSDPYSRFQILLAVAEHLNRHTELQPMLNSVLPLILDLVGLPAGWISLRTEEGFRLVAAAGLPPGLEAEDRAALRWSPCLCQRMLLEGQLVEPANLLECERLARLPEGSEGGDGLRLHVSVPLRTGDRVLGILNLAKAGPELLDQAGLDLLRMIGEQLGVAVDRAQLFAGIKRMQEREEERISRLAQTLVDANTLEEVARAVFEVLRERLEADRLALLVVDPSETYLELVAGWGWARERLEPVRLPLRPPDTNGPAWVLHTRTPLFVGLEGAPYRIPVELRRSGVQAVLLLPMLSGEQPIGVLAAHYLRPKDLPDSDLRFCMLTSRIAAGAVARVQEHLRYRLLFERVPVGLYRSTPTGQILDANEALVHLLRYPDRESLLRTNAAQLYADPADRRRWQQLVDEHGVVSGFEVRWRRYDGTEIWIRESARAIRDASGVPVCYEGSVEDITEQKRFELEVIYLASHDPLTGALNRRSFQEALERRIFLSRDTAQKGAVVFLDLDGFKHVNDRFGHQTGDEVLRTVVRHIRSRLRETDLLGRLGGDEFGILLYPADETRARAVAERVVRAVREWAQAELDASTRITCSCGVALFPDHASTADGLLTAADAAMYAVKARGGDGVAVCAREEPIFSQQSCEPQSPHP
ncbi:MAG: diguanylate cyclase [Armatimonadota bacterium]|nr:diguanylate cyclase [Armatimonadota bacterium]MDR7562474.1 diguanylate cyclase [Armatimonadota bacterium]MDR7566830.1 diguanylate cyclase [Armatimonadota bacterium]MDR7601187.1 diguanylate cyclase [Armatimonadota bacterium]